MVPLMILSTSHDADTSAMALHDTNAIGMPVLMSVA